MESGLRLSSQASGASSKTMGKFMALVVLELPAISIAVE
jgi:hypothetical protein